MPTLQQLLPIFLDQLADPVYLVSSEAMATLQANRIEPKLRLAIVPLNVNMRRFASIARVKEEAIRPHAEYGRHVSMLRDLMLGCPQNC